MPGAAVILQFVLAVALTHLGMPYLWGGKHASQGGWDCSGLISHVLLSAGITEVKDLNSQQIYDVLIKRTGTAIYAKKTGAIAFYGKDLKNIDHVAMIVDPHRIIESAGGDHTFTTIDPAQQAAHHSGVRIRLLNYRPDLVAILYPSYSIIGLY